MTAKSAAEIRKSSTKKQQALKVRKGGLDTGSEC